MSSSFPDRLKSWREQKDFSYEEAAAFINSLQSGPRIAPETLQRIEAGERPTAAARMLLEFFMSAAPPAHLQVRSTEMAALV